MIKSVYKKVIGSEAVSNFLFRPGSGSVWYVEINPNDVEYISVIPESVSSLIGKNAYSGICDGPWDLLKKPFCKNIIYRTAAEVVENIPYRESTIFKSVKTGLRSKNTALSVYNRITSLRVRLLEEGYRSQYQLRNLGRMQYMGHVRIPRHEIVVGIDRNGKLMRLVGGKHRLAVAQHIGIKRIPAILSLVHENAADMIPKRSRLITGNLEDFRPFSKSSTANLGIPTPAFQSSL